MVLVFAVGGLRLLAGSIGFRVHPKLKLQTLLPRPALEHRSLTTRALVSASGPFRISRREASALGIFVLKYMLTAGLLVYGISLIPLSTNIITTERLKHRNPKRDQSQTAGLPLDTWLECLINVSRDCLRVASSKPCRRGRVSGGFSVYRVCLLCMNAR